MMGRGIAVVTGAASGVGAETVSALRADGTTVIALDLMPVPAADGVIGITGDIADPASWESVRDAAEMLGGAPTQLVVNAGKLVVGTLLEVSADDLRSVFEVNVVGAYRALVALLPLMIANGGGAVVTVASVDALVAEQGLAAYCASKGALLQLTRSVAVDHARQGIRANCVCPAAIDTPFFRRHVDAAPDPDAFLAQKASRHPSGRILAPGEVANVVRFLLSDAASGINGAAVTVDGGLLSSFDFHA